MHIENSHYILDKSFLIMKCLFSVLDWLVSTTRLQKSETGFFIFGFVMTG